MIHIARATRDRLIAAAALPALACLLVAALGRPALGAPVRTVTNSVPAPVLGAFQDDYPKAEIRALASLAEGSKVSYEIEGLVGGLTLKAVYLADGTLVAVEEDIPSAALPEAVTAAVEERHPGSKIVKAVRNTRDGATTYLLRVAAGGRRLNLVFDEGGGLLGAKDTGGGKRK
ncbi:hypothetical protein FJ250_00910 [bacterium]|nr:hypothetical protein [bacterium]